LSIKSCRKKPKTLCKRKNLTRGYIMDIATIISSLVGGAVGGNAAGAATQDKNLGTLGNTITGLIGGAASSYILQAMGVINAIATGSGADVANALGTVDWTTICSNLGAGAGGGAVLTAIVTYIKDALAKK
jgi:uncharacterized membrane protein YeaQ/YmgE (transglycosylase-associated protein family)